MIKILLASTLSLLYWLSSTSYALGCDDITIHVRNSSEMPLTILSNAQIRKYNIWAGHYFWEVVAVNPEVIIQPGETIDLPSVTNDANYTAIYEAIKIKTADNTRVVSTGIMKTSQNSPDKGAVFSGEINQSVLDQRFKVTYIKMINSACSPNIIRPSEITMEILPQS